MPWVEEEAHEEWCAEGRVCGGGNAGTHLLWLHIKLYNAALEHTQLRLLCRPAIVGGEAGLLSVAQVGGGGGAVFCGGLALLRAQLLLGGWGAVGRELAKHRAMTRLLAKAAAHFFH